MTVLTIPSSSIPALLKDLGLLVGLLSETGDDVGLDLEWFGDAAGQLKLAPTRWQAQLDLLKTLLGDPVPNSPAGDWHALPSADGQSPVHVVARAGAEKGTGVIGLGIFDNHADGGATLLGAIFAPLFAVPPADPLIVMGRADHPIELRLDVTLPAKVSAGGIDFDGADIACDLLVEDSPPSFTLALTDGGNAVGNVVATLEALCEKSATDWVNGLLASDGAAKWLARPIGGSGFKTGDVIAATGLLGGGAPYVLGDLSKMTGTPEQIAESMLHGALDLLASHPGPLVALGEGGLSVFKTAVADGASDYGVRLQVPDVDLSESGGPEIKVQLGALLNGETDGSSWMSRCAPQAAIAEPGVSLTLLRESGQPPAPAFRAKLDLVSIGLDVTGTSGNALADVGGVVLGGIQPRFLFSLDFEDPASFHWGAAIGAEKVGIPLADGLTKASANPIAQNLLASGGAVGGGDPEPANPTFSLSVAGMSAPGAKPLDVELHADTGSGDTIWVTVQRSFGPLSCRRVGLSWPEPNPDRRLFFLFDGGVSMAALAIDLEGLSLGLPLTGLGQVDSYSLDLQGLGIALDAGPVAISGGLLKAAARDGTVEYDGSATIAAAGWAVSALGSYAELDGHPSLFLFAQLGAEIGGPPFFFVTGLCAGFGYNRSLRLPRQDEVPSFPLLAGIADPSQIGGPNAAPADALAKLQDWIAPAQGVDWVAAGVQFTSFELVHSNVVVSATLTQDPTIALLGVSRIKLAQSGPQFAYAELGLEVVIRPSAGYLGASAVLSPNSYVLTPACHLTGGFAFWIWYSGDHAGDFVITLGGYHPAFSKPSHYPDEPRLGFSWQVSDNLTVQGNAYFALTPSCAMGGGELDVLFHSGDLRAWLTAQADFLFTWQPFYFIGDVRISIGASYKLDLWFTSITISVELGAELDIWGPPTGGRVHIDWYIISFSIGFGADEISPWPPASFQRWDQVAAMLPARSASPTGLRSLAASADDGAELITIALSAGRAGDDGKAWLVRGNAAVFAVSTPIPATAVTFGGTQVYAATGQQLGVRPMGVESAASTLEVSLTATSAGAIPLAKGWAWTAERKGVPAALWGRPVGAGGKPASPSGPSADSLPGWLVGLSGLAPPPTSPTGLGPMGLAAIGYFEIESWQANHWLPLSPREPPVPRQPAATPSSVKTIRETVATAAGRSGLFAALAAMGYDAGADGPMQELAAAADLSYPDPPMLGAPWQEAA